MMNIKETAHYKLINEGYNNKIYLKADGFYLDNDYLEKEFTDTYVNAISELYKFEKNYF